MNIIITGAGSGIGFETALQLSLNAENKILAISKSESGLSKLKIENTNSNIETICYDLAADDYSFLREKIVHYFDLYGDNKINILINNAGYLVKEDFLSLSLDEWSKSLNINLLASVKLIKTLYPFFDKTESKGSHIVNISSMGGVLGSRKFAELSAYSASKAALNSLSESLAVEFRNDNIRVNAICPGTVETKMLNQAFPGYKAPVSATQMGKFIADFAVNSAPIFNGRIIQASLES